MYIMFKTALSAIAERWKPPKCPLKGKWIAKVVNAMERPSDFRLKSFACY